MSLEQIGQKLKAAREAQNVSLRQIYERTRIPLGHLQSIDSAATDELPEPVYVAGYIKRYAECVGLDGQSLSEEYRRSSEEEVNNLHRNAVKHTPVQPAVFAPADFGSRTKINHGPPTFKTLYFNALILVAVVVLVSYLVKVQINNQSSQIDPSLAALRDTTSRFAPPIATLPAATPLPEAGGTPAAAPPADARVSLSASQHVWVEVKSVASGESLFTGYLEQGDRRDFQDTQGLTVRAGNGGSLTVDYQGKNSAFGEAGKITERTFATSTAALASKPAGNSPKTTQPAGIAKSNSLVKKQTTRKGDDSHQASGREKRFRHLDDIPSHQYIPGESLGGSRSIDVPYRYSEGRLDAD